jgi:hypothetical protein
MPDSSAGKQQDSKSEFEFPIGEQCASNSMLLTEVARDSSRSAPCSSRALQVLKQTCVPHEHVEAAAA